MNEIDGHILYASFNYSPPPLIVMLLGVSAALVILWVLSFTRSILAGLFGGGLACAAIAVYVAGRGIGDMTDVAMVFYGVLAAGAGAVAGAISGYFGKRRGGSRQNATYINSDSS